MHPNFLRSPNLEEHLVRLESELSSAVLSDDPFLNEIASHLVGAGGKRIRPTLTLASALAANGVITPQVIQGAAAVELVHLASLHHDDVMDEAASRRGVESVNARWGNLIAVVTGDYLLAKAAGIAAGISQEIAQLLAATLADMCAGQVLEVKSGFDLGRSQEQYFAAISGKTASLMATSCHIGALVSGASPDLTASLTELGHCFGMIFQLRDDIFDLLADETSLGKTPGQDIVEGVYTLPIILALADSKHSTALGELLRDPARAADVSSINRLLLVSGAMEASYGSIERFLARAREIAISVGTPSALELADLAGSLVSSVWRLLESVTLAS